MRIAFQADADLNDDIVKGVKRRIPEIDFQNASDAGLEGLEDEVVLSIAANENRILVTHDRRTMPFHFAEFILKRDCPGVIVVSKKDHCEPCFHSPKGINSIASGITRRP